VSAKTDVEVAILDSNGKVMRHLAAGVLGGEKDPPPPLKPGLAQVLEWDGKDDCGKPVKVPLSAGASGEGGFKVRVRAGMGVKFGKVFGTSPYTGVLSSHGPSDGVALAPDGSAYVKVASLVGTLHTHKPWQLRKLDRKGEYVKTVLPYPPSTPRDKAFGFRLVDAGDGQLTPRQLNPLDPVLFYFGDNIYRRVVDGSVVFIASRRLTFVKVEGPNAIRSVPIRGMKWTRSAVQVAFSPDGRYAYYSNAADIPYNPKSPAQMNKKFPPWRVYRQDLKAKGAPKPFYDIELPDWNQKKFWLPNAWNKKTWTAGIDVDSRGHIFVCDQLNHEVIELSPEGKKLAASRVLWPDRVVAASKSETLYVISCNPAALLKISGRAGGKVTAKLPLGRGKALGQSFALDESGAIPVLWVGGGGKLVRVEDRGAKLVQVGGNLLNRDRTAIKFVCFGDVDAEAELVYITDGLGPVWRYDGETGKGRLMPYKACDLAVGPDGRVYTWGTTGSYAGPVARYTREGKRAPLRGRKRHTYGKVYGRSGRGHNAPGMAVDWQGRLYNVSGFNNCIVSVYDEDGKLVKYHRTVPSPKWAETKGKRPVVIGHIVDQGGSIRVDPRGNIYMLELGMPRGVPVPKGFEKDPAYTRCTGTIHKFPPEGGTFRKGKRGFEAVGAIRRYSSGSGPISGSWASTVSVCHCMRPRFDVDAYGRLFVPHGVTYKVTVLDNADNRIISFGAYGNYDARGPKSSEPKPEIPLGWPIIAGASEKHVYVGDGLNHRVVRVDKHWAAEETCAVR
jgi:sugar lactone lactonase YvrE